MVKQTPSLPVKKDAPQSAALNNPWWRAGGITILVLSAILGLIYYNYVPDNPSMGGSGQKAPKSQSDKEHEKTTLDTEKEDPTSGTAYQEAASRRDLSAMKKLLGKADFLPEAHLNAYATAIALGHLDIVRYYLSQPACVLKEALKQHGCVIAAQTAQKEILKYLMEVYPNPSSDLKFDLLYAAINENHQDFATWLLEDMGFDINVKLPNQTLLSTFVTENKFDQVKYCVDKGADINVEITTYNLRKTPLMLAKTVKDDRIASYLEAKGAKSTAPSWIDRFRIAIK